MTISGRERLWTAPSSRLDPDPRGNCVYVIELYSDIEKKTIKKTPKKNQIWKIPVIIILQLCGTNFKDL